MFNSGMPSQGTVMRDSWGNQISPTAAPRPAAPQGKPAWVSDPEYNATMTANRTNGLMQWQRGALGGLGEPAQQRAESPYDMVGGSYIGGVSNPGVPRWVLDNQRRQADIDYRNSQTDSEYRRWQLEQMKRNQYGMNVRDMIFGVNRPFGGFFT